MPAPYSYDLRQKAIEAFNNGERKSDVCRMLNISRNTLTCSSNEKHKRETIEQLPIFKKGKLISIKSRIGNASRNLSKRMEAKRKARWQSCGGTM